MSLEQNKQVAQLFHDYYNRGNLDGCASLLAPTFRAYFAGAPGPLTGDEFKNMGAAYLAAFPNSSSRTVNLIAEGDTVAALGIFQGTQTGDFMGIPATHKMIQFTWAHFFRVNDGKITEIRVEQDSLGMMQQLGVIPVPGQ